MSNKINKKRAKLSHHKEDTVAKHNPAKEAVMHIVEMVSTAAFFLAILLVAVGLGEAVSWVDTNVAWFPDWAIMLASGVKWLLFFYDIIAIVYHATKHM